MEITQARVLIISDGRVGGTNQSLGIAAMLGFQDPEIITIRRKFNSWWLGWLPVSFLYENTRHIEVAGAKADLAIGAGRGPSRILRHLKSLNPTLFTVAIMRPSGKLTDYDVITIPKHDGFTAAPNVIATMGNTNLITREKMQTEGQRWAKRLSHLRGFKLAVLIGGPSKHGGLQTEDAATMVKALTTSLKKQFTEGAALLVTTSRRTDAATAAVVVRELEASGIPYFLWQPEDPTARDNPYFALLQLCDAIVVTPDSTSMVSEACTSGKPTYLWGKEADMPKKFRHLFTDLATQGRLKWWDGVLNLRPPAAPLLDTMLVAGFVRARWNKRFGGK